jgi:DNA-binding NtrC family response regulator
MNILIAEDELYLAQSISNALSDYLDNPNIILVTTVNDAIILNKNFDIVILSATLNGNIYHIIEKYNNATIILLIPYRNHDTVIAPLNAGVDTYITKPLMIEELIRKIGHHLEFKKLKKENKTYKSYFDMFFKDLPKLDVKNIDFPLFIKSTNKRLIDKYVFDIAKYLNLPISFYDLTDKYELSQIKNDNSLIYLLNFDSLKTNTISRLFDVISKKKVIVELKNFSSFEHPNLVVIDTEDDEINGDNYIMSIEEYIKYIIKKYEGKYPDTELSRRLGISRKSLWEKRKKHGLTKKKTIH